MSLPKQVFRQKDFSAGELDDQSVRRDDNPMMRAGARQASNKRILPTGALEQRPGRSALFEQVHRTEDFVTLAGALYYISFGNGTLRVRDVAGTLVLDEAGYPWSNLTYDQVVWDRYQDTIYITFPGSQPRVLEWTGSAWVSGLWTPRTTSQGQKRTPFTRFSPGGITLAVSGNTGAVNLTFSANVLVAGMVGTRIRYQNRQLTITGVTNGTTGTANVEEKLFGGAELEFATNPADVFTVGEVVEGSNGAKGEVTAFLTALKMQVSRHSFKLFKNNDTITGPNGELDVANAGAVNNTNPPAALTWDEEVFNAYRGWPRSVTVDQNRIIFTDLPSLPRGIAWSAIDQPLDFYPGGNPEDSIFELVPGAARVYHVIPGYDEFVMTSKGVFYIPISEDNPLAPGSVAFRSITVDPVSQVRPALTTEGSAYLSEAKDKVIAIRATGQTARPYLAQEISEFHKHLLNLPKQIIACSGVSGFPDRCVMLLNTDGSVIVGRLDPGREWVGWIPWRNEKAVQWIATRATKLLFTTRYNFTNDRHIVENVDTAAMLDCQMLYNAAPAALAPGGGEGPLWFLKGATVYLYDNGRPIGTRTVSSTGFIDAIEGEDLTSGTLAVGFAWSEILEPFVPHPPEGRSSKQTLRKRKIAKFAVKAEHATGFEVANRRVPAWRLGDNLEAAPTLRNEVRTFKPMGRSHDPRVELLKDIPGKMRVIEISGEVTV